jgi:protein phosphatase PTC6
VSLHFSTPQLSPNFVLISILPRHSDGVCSTIDDQEIVDLCKKAPTPNTAARAIVNYAEDINAQDNCSAMVVPLAGWGKVKGPDRTKERREFRRLHEASSGGRARRD